MVALLVVLMADWWVVLMVVWMACLMADLWAVHLDD